MTNQTVVNELNQQLADWNVLYTKLHNFHWNVKGADFFTLHAKFEEFYNEAGAHVDEIAERILAIKGKPIATMKEFLATSNVEEATGQETARDMVASIEKDFNAVSKHAEAVIQAAEQAEDESTADMFIALKAELDKHTWMLAAYLG
ncbi:Dps family protein [Alkalicoccobacillus plakortidis]|uniref:DNA starvation/stationary phase protection protein n=1 Tax=Alkalicoccobacillus plakortidis TaxID=444060 RepID=A0ABT0XN06_9BACI|nr:Dps family protein [Alkalicoccobacillus plakortidis]MCM2677276.1 DNA starvation/stationary phase protection protein [Alkalicoccobacillus plakortidis]